MNYKNTIEDVRKRFEKYDCELLSTEYTGFKEKYSFICNKHRNQGIQYVYLRNLDRGLCCHYCGKENAMYSKKVSDEDLKKITENAGFIFVRSELINNKTNIVYMCNKHIEHGEFIMSVGNMRKSKGKCPVCLNRTRSHQDFIEEIKTINSNIIILSEFTKTSDKIKCKCLIDGHEWENSAKNLLQGQGCKICATKKINSSKKHTQEWFLSKMNELHPNIEVLSLYENMKAPVECKCKIDGYEWKTTPDGLINGKTGCVICARTANGLKSRKTNEQFLSELKITNPYIVPLEQYKTGKEKIKCLCTIHNYEWYASPNKLLSKMTGCPKCALYHNEQVIANLLDGWNINYTFQKTFGECKDVLALPFDFYLDDYNLVIEYDGEHHYMPIFKSKYNEDKLTDRLNYIKYHDKLKDDFCLKNNIIIIRIPYWENKNIETILYNKFVELNILKI